METVNRNEALEREQAKKELLNFLDSVFGNGTPVPTIHTLNDAVNNFISYHPGSELEKQNTVYRLTRVVDFLTEGAELFRKYKATHRENFDKTIDAPASKL